jgi:hypothetical protein
VANWPNASGTRLAVNMNHTSLFPKRFPDWALGCGFRPIPIGVDPKKLKREAQASGKLTGIAGALPDAYGQLGPRGDYWPHRARIIASKVRPVRNT